MRIHKNNILLFKSDYVLNFLFPFLRDGRDMVDSVTKLTLSFEVLTTLPVVITVLLHLQPLQTGKIEIFYQKHDCTFLAGGLLG